MSTKQLCYRFERKFVVQNEGCPLETIIKTLKIPFRSIHQPRVINNIYFDTHELSAYKDNIFGKANRLKIRVRWYDIQNKRQTVYSPKLEYKIKKAWLGTKKIYSLRPVEKRGHLMNKTKLLEILDASELPIKVKDDLAQRSPILVNQYFRKYFATLDDKIRLTVDSSILFHRYNFSGNSDFSKVNTPIILELKYDKENESYGRRVGQLLPFRLTKYSKYQVGIQKTHVHYAY